MRPAEPSSVRRPDWPALASATVLALGTIAIYSRTFAVPFLFDDRGSIRDNSSIARLWPLWPVLSPPSEVGVGGRPLLNLTYALNHAFGGTAVAGYHAVNLFIHVLAAWTLFALVRRTLLRPVLAGRFGAAATPLALAVSAIWAWHPVQTESVTYLSQRAESLMGLFYLLTLYCFVRGAETDAKGSRRTWFALSVGACLAGVGSKEVIVTAPVMAFLYDRTFISGGFGAAWRRHRLPYVALAATWLPLGRLMIGLQERGVGFGHGVAWWAYGMTECRAVVKYLLLSLWPKPLIFDYGATVVTRASEVGPYILILASLLIATGVALRRAPSGGFLACWFFVILAPASSVIPVFSQPMAENRLYLSLAGVAAFAVLGAFALSGRRSLPVLAFVAAALALGSARRNRDYSSEQSIWIDTISKNPTDARAHNCLGNVWLDTRGRLPDAIAQFEEALRLKPDFEEAHNNLGDAFLRIPGRSKDAIAQYEEALRLRPDFFQARYNLGNALAKTPGRLPEAAAQYEEVLRLKPDYVAAHNNLGDVFWKMPGRESDAILQFEEVVRLKPDFPEAHFNLGNALSKMPGREPDAVAQYEEALRLRPDFPEAHFNMAVTLLHLPGRMDDARAHLEEVLRLRPGYRPAREVLDGIKDLAP